MQYALWLPFAAGARYCGWNWVAHLFLTWFILGELMLVYLHQKIVKLRWWQVLVGLAPLVTWTILAVIRTILAVINRCF